MKKPPSSINEDGFIDYFVERIVRDLPNRKPDDEIKGFGGKQLDRLQAQYKRGEKAALLAAVYRCFIEGKPAPVWVVAAFCRAYLAAERYHIKSWHEVFDPPVSKSTHLATARRHQDLRHDVLISVRGRHRRGQAIDKKMFEDVGEELRKFRGHKISGRLAEKLYYKIDKKWRRLKTKN
jgi:hypothetical protein